VVRRSAGCAHAGRGRSRSRVALIGHTAVSTDNLARLAERTGDVSALDTALAVATRTLQAIAGLVERREELRGRLAAYRVRAARFGAAEDPGLEAYYRAARDLLWSKPCDLAASTRALAAYQKAVLALDGTGGRGGVGA